MTQIKNIIALLFFLPFTGLVFQSCLRDFELKTPEVEKLIAVNCFFTPDSSWSMRVYFTNHIDSLTQNTGIENAVVTVEDGLGKAIQLNHAVKGWYKSEEKPIQGETYKLEVNMDGFKTISAESYVPPITSIENWEYFSKNKIQFKIVPSFSGQFYTGIRGRYFDTSTGYNIYCISWDVIEKIRENNYLPDVIADKLIVLEGQTLYSYNVTEMVQQLLTANENFNYWYFIQKIFEEFAVCGKLNYRPQSLMKLSGCSSDQAIFYQAPNDFTTLLMNQINQQDVEIDCATKSEYQPYLEFWLEYMDLSSDYYYFLKDFLLQVSNREEINTPPVIVYSNIKNGVGIFAGYQTRLFILNEGN